jgi:hypothetical protein
MFFTLRLKIDNAWRGNIELVHNDNDYLANIAEY